MHRVEKHVVEIENDKCQTLTNSHKISVEEVLASHMSDLLIESLNAHHSNATANNEKDEYQF